MRISEAYSMRKSMVATLLLLVAMVVAMPLFSSCGWKGEPIPEFPTEQIDTVYNDLTYTAVTGGITSVSAVAVNLGGYANSSKGYVAEFEEQGFLLSRYVSNPTLNDVSDEEGRQVRKIPVYEVNSDNSIAVRAHGLLPFTKFYYRTYVVRKNGETAYGVVKTFMTIQMSVTMSSPTETGWFDSKLPINVVGIGPLDYVDGVSVKVRCADVEFTSPTVPTDPEKVTEKEYDEIIDAEQDGDSGTSYLAHAEQLVPGRKYYAMAFVEIESDFYNYDEDNPLEWGSYAYGIEPEGVETDKYKSSIVELTSTALAGIRAFSGKNYELDYDAIEIKDNYFTLPSDTLTVTEYGIAIAKGGTITKSNQTLVRSYDELRTGNRFNVYTNNLALKTQYTYRAYVVVHGLTVYSQDVYTFSTKDYTPGYVDLGLSVMWADRNVGAYAPSNPGSYFAWGETASKKSYTDDNYNGAKLTDKQISGTSKDVATVKWGADWRMPTCEEINELYEECEWKWSTENGIQGYRITGPSDESIFLPAGGVKIKSELQDLGQMGYYWTSERASGENDYGYAYELYILNGMFATGQSPTRRCLPTLGLNVRPVYTGK